MTYTDGPRPPGRVIFVTGARQWHRTGHAHPEDRPRPPEAGPSVQPADLRGPLTDGRPAHAGDQSWKSVLVLSSSQWSASARAVRSTCR
jgi:hypothetical protein